MKPKFNVGDHVSYKDGRTPFIISYIRKDHGSKGATRYWGDRTEEHVKGLAMGGYEEDLMIVKEKK